MIADTLLVVVLLTGVGQTTATATLAADSSLVLAAPPVFQLLGLGAPAAPTVALNELRRRYPAVTFAWLPRDLTLEVDDPRGVLPASAAARSATERVARGAFTAVSGPFVGVTADDSGHESGDVGYAWRSRVAVSIHRPVVGPTGWAATVAPWPGLVASVAGDRRVTGATGRIAIGPAWLLTTWAPFQPLAVDGLVAIPHVAVFASSQQRYVLTITAGPLGVQLGRRGQRTTARVTYGPIAPSPFVVPQP